jgi:cellobiose transport system permease protein
MWKSRWAYLFIAPFFVNFFIFDLFPLVFSLFLSLQKWSGFGQMQFVGLDNFRRVLSDERFWNATRNTALLWLGHIFIMMAVALLLAVVLDSKLLRGRTVFRAIYYLPSITAIAAMALVFGLIFDVNFGILNKILTAMHLPAIPWLSSTWGARASIVLFNLWGGTGWYMVIFLAGLQNINPDLYEAASVDGANAWHKLRHVTIPSLRPVLLFVFIIETIGSFEMFTEPFLLTHGGPRDSTTTAGMYIYQHAFEFFNMGYAAAMSLVLFVFVAGASIVQVRFWKEAL